MMLNYANIASRVYQNAKIILEPYYSPFSLDNLGNPRFSDSFHIYLDSHESKSHQVMSFFSLEDNNWINFKLDMIKKDLSNLEYSQVYDEASIILKFDFTTDTMTIDTIKIPIKQIISFLKEIIFEDMIIPDNILENYWSKF